MIIFDLSTQDLVLLGMALLVLFLLSTLYGTAVVRVPLAVALSGALVLVCLYIMLILITFSRFILGCTTI